MEISWIIVSIAGIIILVMMVFIFRENKKTRKEYEDDLNRFSNLYEKDSEMKDVNIK